MSSKKHAFTVSDVTQITGTGYPEPFNAIADGRTKHVVGDHAGLNQYGVNIVNLPPGSGSAQRHWHVDEDEFVYVITGELVLITDDGEETITPGMMMGFAAGVSNGHHLVNRSDAMAVYMETGTRGITSECHYPDIDLHVKGDRFTHKDGTPY